MSVVKSVTYRISWWKCREMCLMCTYKAIYMHYKWSFLSFPLQYWCVLVVCWIIQSSWSLEIQCINLSAVFKCLYWCVCLQQVVCQFSVIFLQTFFFSFSIIPFSPTASLYYRRSKLFQLASLSFSSTLSYRGFVVDNASVQWLILSVCSYVLLSTDI